jgi:hypothetical protein
MCKQFAGQLPTMPFVGDAGQEQASGQGASKTDKGKSKQEGAVIP